MIDVDRPFVSRSTVRQLQTRVRKLRAELDELERWERTPHMLADDVDISDERRWFTWNRGARLTTVRAELAHWVRVLSWAQAQ